MEKWCEFGVASANSRDKKTQLTFTVSQEFIDIHLDIRRLTPLFMLATHVFGALPPINAIAKLESANPSPTLMTLLDAHACFEGIERPHDDEDNGDTVLVYVLKPVTTIEYRANLSCVAEAAKPPNSSVLTVLVRTNGALQDGNVSLDGHITRIEWVLSSPDDNNLPKAHETRYRIRHW